MVKWLVRYRRWIVYVVMIAGTLYSPVELTRVIVVYNERYGEAYRVMCGETHFMTELGLIWGAYLAAMGFLVYILKMGVR